MKRCYCGSCGDCQLTKVDEYIKKEIKVPELDNVTELKKASKAVFIAIDKSIALELSTLLKKAADEISTLREQSLTQQLELINNSSITLNTTAIINAAIDVSYFVKNNEYPREGSREFIELTEKLNTQEIALRKSGYPIVGSKLKQKLGGMITLTIQQIVNLCEFAGISVDKTKSVFSEDKDQLETEIEVVQNKYGAIAWFQEYPEEGGYPLSGKITL